jgi:hypothetical protein
MHFNVLEDDKRKSFFQTAAASIASSDDLETLMKPDTPDLCSDTLESRAPFRDRPKGRWDAPAMDARLRYGCTLGGEARREVDNAQC